MRERVIELRFEEHLSIREIANILGIDPRDVERYLGYPPYSIDWDS